MPEPRKYTEAQKMSAKKWDAANLDRISVAAPKGTKERWKAAAVALDKSLNQLIVEAVDHQISQDRDKGPSEAPESAGRAGVVSLHSEAYKCAVDASKAAREGLHDFVARAVVTQAKRDEAARKLGDTK